MFSTHDVAHFVSRHTLVGVIDKQNKKKKHCKLGGGVGWGQLPPVPPP